MRTMTSRPLSRRQCAAHTDSGGLGEGPTTSRTGFSAPGWPPGRRNC